MKASGHSYTVTGPCLPLPSWLSDQSSFLQDGEASVKSQSCFIKRCTSKSKQYQATNRKTCPWYSRARQDNDLLAAKGTQCLKSEKLCKMGITLPSGYWGYQASDGSSLALQGGSNTQPSDPSSHTHRSWSGPWTSLSAADDLWNQQPAQEDVFDYSLAGIRVPESNLGPTPALERSLHCWPRHSGIPPCSKDGIQHNFSPKAVSSPIISPFAKWFTSHQGPLPLHNPSGLPASACREGVILCLRLSRWFLWKYNNITAIVELHRGWLHEQTGLERGNLELKINNPSPQRQWLIVMESVLYQQFTNNNQIILFRINNTEQGYFSNPLWRLHAADRIGAKATVHWQSSEMKAK